MEGLHTFHAKVVGMQESFAMQIARVAVTPGYVAGNLACVAQITLL
jgi:hypothetical protein